jgi:ribonuclease VapC
VSGRRRKVIVLDTWAVLAYLDGEPAARIVRLALRNARANRVTLLFCIISYGEALYIIERERGLQQAQRAAGLIDQLAVQVVAADRPLVFDAAHIKARYPVSYADAFAVALAKRAGASVMTGDPEFKSVEREIAIRWL